MITSEVTKRLEAIENELKMIRKAFTPQGSIKELAGSWSDYEGTNGEDLETLKNEIYENRQESSQRFNIEQ